MSWRKRVAAWGVVLGVGLSSASDVGASSIRPDYSLEDMLKASDAVVVAKVASRQVVRAVPDGVASEETLTEIHVQRYLRGTGPTIRIVRQLGDTSGVSSRPIDSDARLEVERTCVLFLRHDSERGVDHMTLLGFSAFDLKGTIAAPQVELPPPAKQALKRGGVIVNALTVPLLGRPMTFETLERFVSGAIK